MASEATKKATRGNIHMDSRVFDIADLKSEVIFSLPLSYAGLHAHCPLVHYLTPLTVLNSTSTARP